MKKYLLPRNGNFYKANLHCHTTFSDGRKTPEEIKEIYKERGYSVVAYTDHDILISHDELNDDSFLALHGFEVEVNEDNGKPWPEIKTCHICFIGLEPENIIQPCWHRSSYLFGNAPNYRHLVKFDENEPDFVRHYDGETISQIMKTARDKGFFVTYNHPTWSKEVYTDYINYHGMHAFEIFNGGCISEGFDDYNPRVYDDLLMHGEKLYCVGGDDNHNAGDPNSRRYDVGHAWTTIKADKLDYRTITKALEDGNFYATEGPEIYDLWYEGDKVHITCSDADRILCAYGIRNADVKYSENGVPVTEAEFTMYPAWKYFRITVIDKQGRHACTNAYFGEALV